MLSVVPYGRNKILGNRASEASDLLAAVVPEEELGDLSQRPSLQLSHQEISEEHLEQVFGFAGITAANGPVGLPGDFEPRKLDRDYLIFPLPRLEAHLRNIKPEIIAEYERHASFEQFLESRDMEPRDYLATGLLECIKWCCQHRAGLAIRW